MSLTDEIRFLSGACGISGFEKGVALYLKKVLENKFDEVKIDKIGNVIACKKSESGCGRVMLEAHMDEIGLMVKKIDDNGFLEVVPVGGIDPRILPGNMVTVHSNGRNYKGVIGAKPPHVMSLDEYESVLGFDNLFIDCGFTCNEAKEKIIPGATVTFLSEYTELLNGNIFSKSMDDRASVAVILDVAQKLADADLDYDLYFCICVQEEVGLRGSAVAAYTVNPDFAIAIDVTHANTPDESKLNIKCGSGIAVCKGPNIHPSLVSSFTDFLNKEKILYEIEIEGGNTGTDAWAIQTAREGVPVMLLSLPLKYMHTPVETVSLDDCKVLSGAISKYLKSFKRTEDVLCF